MLLNGLLLWMITFKSLCRWSIETCTCLLALGRGQILTVVMFNTLFQYSQYFSKFAGSVRHSVLWASSPRCLNILGLYHYLSVNGSFVPTGPELFEDRDLISVSQYLCTIPTMGPNIQQVCRRHIFNKWAARRVDIKILVLLWLSICCWHCSPQSFKSTYLRCNSLNKGMALNWLPTC